MYKNLAKTVKYYYAESNVNVLKLHDQSNTDDLI